MAAQLSGSSQAASLGLHTQTQAAATSTAPSLPGRDTREDREEARAALTLRSQVRRLRYAELPFHCPRVPSPASPPVWPQCRGLGGSTQPWHIGR